MAEYIDKQAAIDEVDEWYNIYPDSDTAREALSLLKKAIKKISPEDVRPVIRGRWINEERVGFGSVEAECSNCGRRMIYNSAWRCCPWCMADMRRGDAEWESTSSTTQE